MRDGYDVSRIVYINDVPYYVDDDRRTRAVPDRLHNRFEYRVVVPQQGVTAVEMSGRSRRNGMTTASRDRCRQHPVANRKDRSRRRMDVSVNAKRRCKTRVALAMMNHFGGVARLLLALNNTVAGVKPFPSRPSLSSMIARHAQGPLRAKTGALIPQLKKRTKRPRVATGIATGMSGKCGKKGKTETAMPRMPERLAENSGRPELCGHFTRTR